jgi:hypothetical protein
VIGLRAVYEGVVARGGRSSRYRLGALLDNAGGFTLALILPNKLQSNGSGDCF